MRIKYSVSLGLLLLAVNTLGLGKPPIPSALSRTSIKSDGPPPQHVDMTHIADAKPKVEPLSPHGNPPSYQVFGKRYYVADTSKGYRERGFASWYGTKFHGKLTSSKESYDMFQMTAAHKTLPIPCYVHVTNLENGRHVVVKVNDRGPFHDGRIIDLSYAAAQKLGMLERGTALVHVETIEPSPSKPNPRPAIADFKAISKRLYLQIGAFGERAHAKHFADQIQRVVYHPVAIHEAKLFNRPIYRVKVGPVADETQGNAVNDLLKKAGLTKGLLVSL
jgi:rare lipoprotein A